MPLCKTATPLSFVKDIEVSREGKVGMIGADEVRVGRDRELERSKERLFVVRIQLPKYQGHGRRVSIRPHAGLNRSDDGSPRHATGSGRGVAGLAFSGEYVRDGAPILAGSALRVR